MIPTNMPLRSHRPSGRGQRPNYTNRVKAIALERERRMADVRSLAGQNLAPGSFVHKARTLLTLGWSKATWRSRASIIHTVDWLLDLERANQTRAGG